VAIYFFAVPALNMVKIGFSRDVDARFRALSSMFPVEFQKLLELDGGRKLEKKIHSKFQRFRKHGEWFDYCNEIKAFVEEEHPVQMEFNLTSEKNLVNLNLKYSTSIRHQKFVAAILSGLSQAEAYILAGYRASSSDSAYSGGSRLARRQDIRSEIERLKTQMIHQRRKMAESKLNPRHEKFIQGILEGKTQTQAYIDAGYKPKNARHNASRLMTKDAIRGEIQRRLVEAREPIVKKWSKNGFSLP
jgi:phage terminase small subunit